MEESKEVKSVLQEAEILVKGARDNNYGHPYHDFSRTAKMWTAILGTEVTPQMVGMCMVALKLSREVNKHKRDNLVDIGGYALTVQMIEDYEKNN